MTVETPKRRLLKAKEMAAQLNISLASVYRKRSLGEALPEATRIGGTLRWTQESIDTFLEENTERKG